MLPEVAVAAEERVTERPSASGFTFPEEMSAVERERWTSVLEMRREGAPARDDITEHPHYWWDQIPYGCDAPAVYDIGSQYWISFDDGDWAGAWWEETPAGPGHGTNEIFWACFIPEYNSAVTMYDTIPAGYTWSSGANDWVPQSTSFLYSGDENFSVQWAMMRGETMLDYCGGNASECARGQLTYYADDGGFTCEESLVVVMWDLREPGWGLVFGYEIFDDVPWDEYFVCS
jgi:hypothetical protein